MALTFPTNPTPNQVFTSGLRAWTWDATIGAWVGGDNMIIGSLGLQNSNQVSITGGNIAGLTTLSTAALTVSGVAILTGNVGIGTANPTSKLDVAGGEVSIATTGQAVGDWVSLKRLDGTELFKWMLQDNGSGANGDLTLQKNGGGGGVNVITFQRNTGNVGIGTTNPSFRLDVAGTFNVSGNATMLGMLTTTGKITANGQGTLSSLGENDVVTRDMLTDMSVWDYYWGGVMSQINGSGTIVYDDSGRKEFLKFDNQTSPYLWILRSTAAGTNKLPMRVGSSSLKPDYSSYFEFSGMMSVDYVGANVQIFIDLWRGTIGGVTANLARKGIRLAVTSAGVSLHVFNTALTTSTVVFTPAANVTFSYRIINYGNGNVGLSINRGAVTVLSGGPTGLGSNSDVNAFVGATNTVSTPTGPGHNFSISPARIYWP